MRAVGLTSISRHAQGVVLSRPGQRVSANGAELAVGPLVRLSAFRENLVNDARERCSGVDDDAVFRNVSFRLMQAHSEFPFLRFSAEVSWVQRHSLINPPVHGV